MRRLLAVAALSLLATACSADTAGSASGAATTDHEHEETNAIVERVVDGDTIEVAIIGNRGVKNGSLEEQDYLESVTLGTHGGAKSWLGNTVFNDNHVEVFNTFTPEGLNYKESGVTQVDNLFRNDMGNATSYEGEDSWLAIVNAVLGAANAPDENLLVSTVWD